MAPLQLRVIGGFVLLTGQPVEIWSKKNQALFTYLALHADKKLTRETLISLLWSDRREAQARSSLRQALAALKRDLVASSCRRPLLLTAQPSRPTSRRSRAGGAVKVKRMNGAMSPYGTTRTSHDVRLCAAVRVIADDP
jgi:hypothetical protein